METTAAWVCSVLFFHLPLILGSSIYTGTDSNCSSLHENSILPCKKEELQCGNGLCLLNWLRCHHKKDCGKDYVSIKITCSKVHLNQNSPISEFSHYTKISSDTNMLGSAVLVAGVVIGVVLFLSCVTIIVGSLRKYRCFRHPQLQRIASYTPDIFYFCHSIGELRSSCIEEFPSAFDFSSYVETLSQVNVMRPDSPPHYDECVGPGAAQTYVPTDDPPPYSLIDPCPINDFAINMPWEEEVYRGTTGRAAGYLVGLRDQQQPISSISLSSSFPMEAAPSYDTVVYDECVGPGATQIYIPMDDPPPYSLTDPYQLPDFIINIPWEEEGSSGTTGRAAGYLVGLRDQQQPISSISLSSSFPTEAAPPYETVMGEQNVPIPLVPLDVLKNDTDDHQTLFSRIM